jgi:AmmeMemoRadiSam system protein B
MVVHRRSGCYNDRRDLMPLSSDTRFPKLRPVDLRPIVYQGQRLLLLRDPLQLSDKTLLVPQVLGPVLALCDGTREDAGALGAALAIRYGLPIDTGSIRQLLEALDEALLLDNERHENAKQAALDEFRDAPFRPPALAGSSYPEEADELRGLLASYSQSSPQMCGPDGSSGLGLISPHIDYARGGQVYAQVWKQAEESVRDAELVIIFGTDHFGGDASITLTRQHYATPFGVLPTARDIVDELAQAIGEQSAFEGELRHRGEHSVELAAVWLHHTRQELECEVVPILCGSFARFTSGLADATDDERISGIVAVLREKMQGRRTVVVAAADLAHVGPAFGGAPVDHAGRGELEASDTELIDRMCAGDAEGFLAAIKRVDDSNNVCGVSPIYLALRTLAGASGHFVAYDRCPADEQGTSLVSICGVVFGTENGR